VTTRLLERLVAAAERIADALECRVPPDAAKLARLLGSIHDAIGENIFTAGSILDRADLAENGLLFDVVLEICDGEEPTREELGRKLSAARGSIAGGYALEFVDSTRKVNRWRVLRG
jgi:hypothetical protein